MGVFRIERGNSDCSACSRMRAASRGVLADVRMRTKSAQDSGVDHIQVTGIHHGTCLNFFRIRVSQIPMQQEKKSLCTIGIGF